MDVIFYFCPRICSNPSRICLLRRTNTCTHVRAHFRRLLHMCTYFFLSFFFLFLLRLMEGVQWKHNRPSVSLPAAPWARSLQPMTRHCPSQACFRREGGGGSGTQNFFCSDSRVPRKCSVRRTGSCGQSKYNTCVPFEKVHMPPAALGRVFGLYTCARISMFGDCGHAPSLRPPPHGEACCRLCCSGLSLGDDMGSALPARLWFAGHMDTAFPVGGSEGVA